MHTVDQSEYQEDKRLVNQLQTISHLIGLYFSKVLFIVIIFCPLLFNTFWQVFPTPTTITMEHQIKSLVAIFFTSVIPFPRENKKS